MAPQRILIVRLGAMGDILHTLPAAATIRENCPRSHIAWLVEPRWMPLLEGNPHVDELLPFDRRAISSAWSALRLLRERSFDLAVDFQGLIKSALPAWLSGASTLLGYSRRTARESVAAMFYARSLTPTARHVVDQHLELASFAAGPKRRVEFPIPKGREEGSAAHGAPPEGMDATPRDNAGGALPEQFMLACPLAGWASKQWPLARYAELASILRERLGVPLVLNGAPSQEAQLRSVAGARVHISGLAGLIDATRRATAVIGLDSGPLHLAAALGKPGAALYGPTDPARNGPYCDTIAVLRDSSSVTTYKRQGEPEPGLASIGAERVFEALRAALRDRQRFPRVSQPGAGA